MYQPRANAPLDAMAKLCGFPGKLGMDGSQVYGAYLDGRRDEIRRYCETDAMNTYLLYCRFQKMRGGFTRPSTSARSRSPATPSPGSANRTGANIWPRGRPSEPPRAHCATWRHRRPVARAEPPPDRDSPMDSESPAERDSRQHPRPTSPNRSSPCARSPRPSSRRPRSTSTRRASASSRRAWPGAGWSCGSGRPSRRR